MILTLKGKPRSTNNIYRSTCMGKFARVYMSAEGKALKEDYQWQAKSQWKKQPLKGNIGLQIDLYFGDLRKNDIDNFNKLLFDSLTGIVWVDDTQIQEMTVRKNYDKKEPKIEIEIYEL